MSTTLEVPLVTPWDVHNETLVSNVHPLDWINPEPAPKYNMVVIGAGTAGLVSAAGSAGVGAKVAIIEKRLVGGDCLNVGCVPSKALIRASRAWADVRDAGDFGVVVPPGAKIDFPTVMERMRRLRARISVNDSVKQLQEKGVDVFLGQGEFAGPDAITVDGKTLRFSKAVIATGARAADPGVPGLREAGYRTNETIFELTELPERLAVIGSGPIGCELSQAFARFGSAVYILERSGRIMGREDRDAVARVEAAFRKDRVQVLLNTKILRAERRGGQKILHLDQAGKIVELAVDEVLVGVGRAPNVEGLGLEKAGVAFDARQGVQVNDLLQTSNAKIYAAGDICSRFKFTHAAEAMAAVVIQNALFPLRRKASSLVIPWCTYTDPEVAHVGLYEKEALERGLPVQTVVQELKEIDRAVLDGEDEGFIKVHVNSKTSKILGATIVARHAGEMMNEITLAMTAGVSLKTLASVIHPYPTQAESIKRAGGAYYRTKVTPLVKKILTQWLAWQR